MPRDTKKCPLSILNGVRIKRINVRNSPLYTVFRIAEIKNCRNVCPLIVDRNQPISARELTQSDCKKNRTFKHGVASVIRDFYFTPLYLMLLSGYVL